MFRGDLLGGNVRVPSETRTLVHKQNRSEWVLYTEWYGLSRPEDNVQIVHSVYRRVI